jgi:hypothetical protein
MRFYTHPALDHASNCLDFNIRYRCGLARAGHKPKYSWRSEYLEPALNAAF